LVWNRLGHCIVWYMVMNVLEEHFGCFLLAAGRWAQCVLTNNPVPITQVTRPLTWNLKIMHFSCIVSLPYLITNQIPKVGIKYTLFCYIRI
jgi:hypothetical protein